MELVFGLWRVVDLTLFRRFLVAKVGCVSDWRKLQPPTSKQGFTLIELLVVITIAGILTAITIPSLISFNRRQTLKNAALDIKSALRFAQNKALAAEVDNDACGIPPIAGIPRLRGWYTSFVNSSDTYNISGRCVTVWDLDNKPADWTDFGTRSFQLPLGITFSNLSPSPVYILFEPAPTGVSFYSNQLDLDKNQFPSSDPAKIIKVTNLAGESEQVTVNTTGEIK